MTVQEKKAIGVALSAYMEEKTKENPKCNLIDTIRPRLEIMAEEYKMDMADLFIIYMDYVSRHPSIKPEDAKDIEGVVQHG